jgi:hypothetical protein
MKLEEIRIVLEAEWSGGTTNRPDCCTREVRSCHASDLLSDVLTSCGVGSILLTGLTNAQVVRVAEISDFAAVCFVRGKKPQPDVAQLAEAMEIPLLVTHLSMFESCGRLYAKGLPGVNGAKEDAKCQRQK